MESITTNKSSSPSLLVDMSTFKTIKNGTDDKNTETSMMKNITRPTEVPDDEVLCECCNKMIWYGDYVQVQSCQHKMCTLCYIRGQMTTQQGPHRCPVPNCNELATSCEYFCFSSATSEIMNPTQSQSNLFPPTSTPSPTMRRIGTVTPAPRKSPPASDEDENMDFGRSSSGESLDTPASSGAEALLMFANDNSSVDYSGGYVAGGGSMGEEDYSTDNSFYQQEQSFISPPQKRAGPGRPMGSKNKKSKRGRPIGSTKKKNTPVVAKTPIVMPKKRGPKPKKDHVYNGVALGSKKAVEAAWEIKSKSSLRGWEKRRANQKEAEKLAKKKTPPKAKAKPPTSAKVKKPKTASSSFNGVCKAIRVSQTTSKYEANFSKWRLGTYTLEADAALAYDSAVRKSGLEQHFCKINFDSEADYMKTRTKEIKSRKIDAGEVDLEDTLAMITDKVQHCNP